MIALYFNQYLRVVFPRAIMTKHWFAVPQKWRYFLSRVRFFTGNRYDTSVGFGKEMQPCEIFDFP